MSKFTKLKSAVLALEPEAEKFYKSGNKAAGTRLRAGLQQIKVIAQDIRQEVAALKKEKTK